MLRIVVGYRGFPAQSVWKIFQIVGMTSLLQGAAARQLAYAAEKASWWIWNSEWPNWKPGITSSALASMARPRVELSGGNIAIT